ncbi:MAG: ribonuclease III, partial [Lachnospiraceae bacterium]|nr:ribonuclease III [Lachnospiraceae bacterium]
MHREDLDNLEEIIGYKFKNRELLVQALTHSSYANELKMNRKGDYQRMEFLGDAVLELVASEELYDKSPGMTEGELSKKRSSMVCEPALATCTRAIGLQEFVRLGKGEEMSQGRQRDSIASDVMEALIGAIFLDDGFDSAAVFVRKAVMGKLENKKVFRDSKSML